MIYLWEQYFFSRLFRASLLFLGSFYAVYVLIDYSSHLTLLGLSGGKSWLGLTSYYLATLAARAEILLPITLLLATIKTTVSLNEQGLLTALMGGGIAPQTLARPFLIVGWAAVALLYLNQMFLAPHAAVTMRNFEDGLKVKRRPHAPKQVQQLVLPDGSLLLFDEFDFHSQRFSHVYWLSSNDEVYRFRYLYPLAVPPRAEWVDHFERTSEGFLSSGRFETIDLPKVKFSDQLLRSAVVEPEMLPPHELIKKSLEAPSPALQTTLYWKCLSPWLALLAVWVPLPMCFRFSRALPKFGLYFLPLFLFLGFYMLLNALQILAKRHVMLPEYAMFLPYCWVPALLLLRCWQKRWRASRC